MIIGSTKWSNWSSSAVCKPQKMVAPKDEVDLAATVRGASGSVRVSGSGMSPSPLCATDGVLVGVSAFNGLCGFDCARALASVGAGTPMWEIASLLHREGYGLNCMGDNDRGSLGGSIAVGCHGSGWQQPCLSADVERFSLVLADGEIVNCDSEENREIFAAGRMALGLFGVMTEIGIRVRPRYKLMKSYFVHSEEETFRQLDGMVKANRNFEFAWYPWTDGIVCKSLNETTARAPEPRPPVAMRARGERLNLRYFAISAINEMLPFSPALIKPAQYALSFLRKSFGRVRWSNEAFPTPRVVRYNELEYAVPYENGADAVREIAETIRKRKIVSGFPLVFRVVDADDIWLSPFFGRRCATISVQQYYRQNSQELFTVCEEILRRYGGRPHWGTLHSLGAEDLAGIYPQYDAFRALRRKLDPKGKFLNSYLRTLFPE